MSPVLYSNCHCLIPVMWLCYIDLHAMNITISRWGIMPTYATAQGHAYNIPRPGIMVYTICLRDT